MIEVCPVCKKMPVARQQPFSPKWRVECKDCEIAGMADTLDTAIAAWNDFALSVSEVLKQREQGDDDGKRT